MSRDVDTIKIELTIQQIITYAAILITFGASIYTFYEAIPKIDKLNEISTNLDKNIAISEVKINRLILDVQNLQKTK